MTQGGGADEGTKGSRCVKEEGRRDRLNEEVTVWGNMKDWCQWQESEKWNRNENIPEHILGLLPLM